MTTGSQTHPVRHVVRVIGVVGLGVALALVTIIVLVPKAAGGQAYTVLSSSMEPVLAPGSLAMVRPASQEDIGVGSVITYQLASKEPAVVTHRVVSMGVREDGSPVYQTQGDANDDPDPTWVRPVQVIGTAWYAVPYLGRLNNLLTQERREQLLRGVAVLLLTYGVVELALAGRERIVSRSQRRRHARPRRGRHE